MVFVALYINTKNELCTVLKDSIYIIYGKNYIWKEKRTDV